MSTTRPKARPSAQSQTKLAVPLAPLLPRLEFEKPPLALIAGAADAAEAIARLEAAGHLSEAIKLTAHALPKREAVWWGCVCARAVPDAEATPADATALDAAELWVRKPEEANRRAAMAAAEAAGFRSTEAWAAVGAFWSSGSITPEGQAVVPPGEHLTGVAIGGGVLLAGVRLRPLEAEARYARFLASARDIGQGGAGRIPPEPLDDGVAEGAA